jgi:hypothetical protein
MRVRWAFERGRSLGDNGTPVCLSTCLRPLSFYDLRKFAISRIQNDKPRQLIMLINSGFNDEVCGRFRR